MLMKRERTPTSSQAVTTWYSRVSSDKYIVIRHHYIVKLILNCKKLEGIITLIVFVQNHTVSGQMGHDTAQNLRFLSTIPRKILASGSLDRWWFIFLQNGCTDLQNYTVKNSNLDVKWLCSSRSAHVMADLFFAMNCFKWNLLQIPGVKLLNSCEMWGFE
jgi:hypothetical protein